MVACLKGLDKVTEYHLIESAYGHDAFLLEHETFAPLVRDFLGRADG
jgi:homoserine O-acetyltransferase